MTHPYQQINKEISQTSQPRDNRHIPPFKHLHQMGGLAAGCNVRDVDLICQGSYDFIAPDR